MKRFIIACASFALLSLPLPLLAFMQDIPEDIAKKPEQEQLQWLNQEFEQAYTLQLKVAQERHEQRMGMKDQVVQTLANQAFEREKLIADAEQQTREELEQVAKQTNAAFGGLIAMVVLAALAAWWRWGRSVEVEVTAGGAAMSAEKARADAKAMLEELERRRSRGRGTTPPKKS
jgi:hypothetical protein